MMSWAVSVKARPCESVKFLQGIEGSVLYLALELNHGFTPNQVRALTASLAEGEVKVYQASAVFRRETLTVVIGCLAG